MIDDGRIGTLLALLGIAGAAVARGSRGIARSGRSPAAAPPGLILRVFLAPQDEPYRHDPIGFYKRTKHFLVNCFEQVPGLTFRFGPERHEGNRHFDVELWFSTSWDLAKLSLTLDSEQYRLSSCPGVADWSFQPIEGSRGVVRRGQKAESKVYQKTERISYNEPGSRWKTAVVSYGFDPRGVRANPEHVSFTFMIGTGPSAAKGGVAGDRVLLQKHLPRRLWKMARWHFTKPDGTPIHYVANAVYYAEIATGRKPRAPGDHDPVVAFKDVSIWGAVPEIDHGEPWKLPNDKLERWLDLRLPFLKAQFAADLDEAGIAPPPPPLKGSPARQGSAETWNIPGPYARPGALASFNLRGSHGIIRTTRHAAPQKPQHVPYDKCPYRDADGVHVDSNSRSIGLDAERFDILKENDEGIQTVKCLACGTEIDLS